MECVIHIISFLVSKFGLSLFLSPLKCVGLEIQSSISFFLHSESKQNWEWAQTRVRKAITECVTR